MVQSKAPRKQNRPRGANENTLHFKSPSVCESLLSTISLHSRFSPSSQYTEAYILHLEAFRKALSFKRILLRLFSSFSPGRWAIQGPGSKAWTRRLSVDDLALLTYCFGAAPSPGMGLWTGTKSLPPQMLPSHQILCQFSEWCITLLWIAARDWKSSNGTRDIRENQLR